MRRTRGFTLIELMVVITIIALLLTILLPGLAKALELARRAKCGANLKGIGEGLQTKDAETVMYGSGGGAGLPWAQGTSSSEQHLSDGLSDSDRAKDPWGDNALSDYPVSTNMFALTHKADVSMAAFVCPSSTDKIDEDVVDDDGEKYWDFVDNTSISYSFQAPLVDASGGGGDEESPFTVVKSTVVVMADQNPLSIPSYGSTGQPWDSELNGVTTWEALDDLEEPHDGTAKGMTINHKGEYVNALRYSGELFTSFRADIGYDEDCIWTAGGTDQQDWRNEEGTRVDVDEGSDYSSQVGQHNHANDTFLIDTPNNGSN